MRVLISAEGAQEPPGLLLMAVDDYQFLIDLSAVLQPANGGLTQSRRDRGLVHVEGLVRT
jgi:hypothetical protein